MTELKPCPFCGGCGHVYEDGRLSIKPYNFPKWYITCKKCGVKTPTAKIEQVVRIWNRRVNDDAMDMAIEALKCSETPKSSERTAETAQNVKDEDLISRKAAIDAIEKIAVNERDTERGLLIFCGLSAAITVIDDLPSAQPETAKRIVGKSRDGMTLWYQCDMCNEPVNLEDLFCSGCGRRLTDG